ncbi:hypothetical protein [Agrobacterium sp. CNPSo 2736]|uniref:hypothetical protein n=1 Tax=Agrobacterium sp. CNPSo 2736 TaxID=2499627 RepID=UPI0013E299FC|nr:hypothetical protein [Agrobacterium sp. CNPSo 2736]
MFREKEFRDDFNAIDAKRHSLAKAIEKILAGGGIDQTRHRSLPNGRQLQRIGERHAKRLEIALVGGQNGEAVRGSGGRGGDGNMFKTGSRAH